MRQCLPLVLLLAAAACAPPPPGPVAEETAAPARPLRGDAPATRRGGGRASLAWEGAGGCGRSVLDSPLLAQRLMAATFADGPAAVEARVVGCRPGFRAL